MEQKSNIDRKAIAGFAAAPLLDGNTEIYISIRVDGLRKSVAEVQGAALPADVAARAQIIEALKASGYEIIATGEGKYADVWVKRTSPSNKKL